MVILAIGAHPDDIEYGCFGTLCKLKDSGGELYYLTLSYGGDGGDWVTRKDEQAYTAEVVGASIRFGGLQSALLQNNSGRESIKLIEDSLRVIKPDVVFSHSRNDVHQDHRLVNRATESACRLFKGELYYYEGYSSLKYFKPTICHNIDKYFNKKIEIISKFSSQENRFYMNSKVIESIAMFRAAQFGFMGKAEAFEVGKVVVL